jgi:hypothetical protein
MLISSYRIERQTVKARAVVVLQTSVRDLGRRMGRVWPSTGDAEKMGERRLGGERRFKPHVSAEARVIYIHAIKKVANYAHAMKNFPSTCMPCT